MRMHRSISSLFLGAVLATTGLCALPAVSYAAPAAQKAHAGDSEALAFLVAVNEHEIEAGKQAVGKGVSGGVMDFAKKMQAEHGMNITETRRVATESHVKIADTADIRAMRKQNRDERMSLQKLSGAAYSAAYVDAMVKGHAEVLAKIDDKLIPQSTDAKVIAHLKATRVHVAEHLAAAKALQGMK